MDLFIVSVKLVAEYFWFNAASGHVEELGCDRDPLVSFVMVVKTHEQHCLLATCQ